MKDVRKALIASLVVLTVMFSSVVALGAPVKVTEDQVLRRDNQGPVGVEIVFLNPLGEVSTSDELVFRVYLTTHSGDISRLNLAKMVSFRTSDGKVVTDGITWKMEQKSSHHPVGLITVPARPGSIIGPQTEHIQLTIEGLGGVENRTFVWEKEVLPFNPQASTSTDKYYALVPNAADGTVSVVDVQTAKVINSIPVGQTASHGIAVSPDGSRIYSGDMDAGKLVVLDIRNQKTVAELQFEGQAHGVDISPDGKYVFVAGAQGKNVLVLDTKTNKFVATITDGIGDSPSHMEFDPNGRFAYLADPVSDYIAVIDITSLKVVDKIPVGDGPNEGRITPDGKTLYVANWESNEISVVDVKQRKVIKSIPAGSGTHGVVVSPDGREVWTANRKTNDITIIDAGTNKAIENVLAGEYANHLAFSPDGKYVLVTNQRSNELLILDAKTRQLVSRVKVGSEPHEVDFVRGTL